jgi:hypothetical protein
MVNITIFISEELQKRLEEFPNINRSSLFQKAAEREIEIRKKMSGIKIPEEKLEKIKNKLIEQSFSISFELGGDVFLIFALENADIRQLSSIAEIPYSINSFENIQKYVKIEEYEKVTKEKGILLDRDQFARGFIASAKALTRKLI